MGGDEKSISDGATVVLGEARIGDGSDLELYNSKPRLGDYVFISGAPGTPMRGDPRPRAGNIIFKIGQSRGPSKEVLRIGDDGFFIGGERITDGKAVHDAFCRWLEAK